MQFEVHSISLLFFPTIAIEAEVVAFYLYFPPTRKSEAKIKVGVILLLSTQNYLASVTM